MAISPEFNKMKSTKIISLEKSSKVECKLALDSNEASNVLLVQAVSCLDSIEKENGCVKYSGKVLFNVVYLSENKIKKSETGVEFSFKLENDKIDENSKILPTAHCENTTINFLNGIATAFTTLNFKCFLFAPTTFDYLKDEGQCVLKKTPVKCQILKDCIYKDFKIEDEFNLSYAVENVLSHDEKVVVTSCQSGIGAIIIDGEIQLKVAYLVGDSTQIKCECKKIPFRVEVDSSEVMPNLIPLALVDEKSSTIKVYVDEGKNKSTVSAEIMLSARCGVFEYQEVELVEDCYLKTNELKIKKDTALLNEIGACQSQEFKCQSEISLVDDENAGLICVVNDKIEGINVENRNGTYVVIGAISLTGIFSGEKHFSKSVLVPFEVMIDSNVKNLKLLKVEVCDLDLKGNTCEFNVKILYAEEIEKNFSIITALEEGVLKPQSDSAITVYLPSEDETLWDISKALCVSEEEILKNNQGLVFPLTGDERIVIFRQHDKD